MRRRFLVSCLLIFTALPQSKAQQPPADNSGKYSFNYRKVVPGMPENASLGSYGNVPVSTAKGVPDISFNLYTLSKGGVDVPISIAYDASGIKYNDIASSIGLKWSLSAGGSVNRSVNGMVDEDFLLSNMNYINPGFIEYENFHPNAHQTQDSCKYVARNSTDCSLDYFYYNFPGHSGSMYLASDLGFKPDKEYRQLKVTYTNHIDTVIIKDGSGNTYYFGAYTDQSTVYNTGKYNAQASSSFGARVSWKLRKIVTATKQDIYFEYANYYYEYTTIDSERWTVYLSDGGEAYCPCSDVNFYYIGYNEASYQTTHFVNTAWLVSKIYTDDQEVLFNYTTNTSAPIFQKQLSSIKVYSKISTDTIRYFSFAHDGDYLTSFEEKGKAGVSVGKKTSFEYKGGVSSTFGVSSLDRDIFGYFNASSNIDLMANEAALAYYYPLPQANRYPNSDAAAIGTLSDIIYPTGGRTTMEYEYNMDDSTGTIAPGLRVKTIMDIDGNNKIYNKKIFHYGPLSGGNYINSLTINTESTVYLEPTMVGVFYSDKQDDYGRDNFEYGTVLIESVEDGNDSVHLFEKEYNGSQYGLFDIPVPMLVRKDIFIDDTFHLQQSTIYDYTATPVDNVATKTYLLRKAFPYLGNYSYDNDPRVFTFCPPATIYDGYDIAHNLKPYLYDLTTVTTKQYSSVGDSLITVVNNQYSSKGSIQETSTIVSDGTKNVIMYSYPDDYPGDATLTRMKDSAIYTPVVTERYLLSKHLIKEKRNNYAFNGNGFFTVSNQVITDAPTGKTQTLNYYGYNQKGQPLSMGRTGDITTSYIWDYLNDMPIAEVVGADTSHIAYTSFEADGKGRWTFSGTPAADTTSVTGKKDYALGGGSITRSGLSSSVYYIVSYWSKSGSLSITGTQSGWPKALAAITRKGQNWTLYEHKITGQTTITVSGSVTIDELRLYPETARMTSYTYEPLIGISSQSDINGRIAYYTYDAMGRLILVRDQYNNILKKVCYNYSGQVEDCPQSMYWSKAMSVTLNRNNCGAGYNSTSVLYLVSWGAYSSSVSQAAADQLAQDDIIAHAQTYANTNGDCIQIIYHNVVKSETFNKSDCGTGYPGNFVTYTVPANTYNSTISQVYVDSMAQAEVDANGQAYANAHGACMPYCSHCLGDDKKCIAPGNCETGTKVYTASVWIPEASKYRCTYHYEWSDATLSSDYTEYSVTTCL